VHQSGIARAADTLVLLPDGVHPLSKRCDDGHAVIGGSVINYDHFVTWAKLFKDAIDRLADVRLSIEAWDDDTDACGAAVVQAESHHGGSA
jgi:hypothetical protein